MLFGRKKKKKISFLLVLGAVFKYLYFFQASLCVGSGPEVAACLFADVAELCRAQTPPRWLEQGSLRGTGSHRGAFWNRVET